MRLGSPFLTALRRFLAAPSFYVPSAVDAAQPAPSATRQVVGVFRQRPDGSVVFRGDDAPDRTIPVVNPDQVPAGSLDLPVVTSVRGENEGVRVMSPLVLEAVASWNAQRGRFPRGRFERLHDAYASLSTRADEAMRAGTMSPPAPDHLVPVLTLTEREIVEAYGALGQLDDDNRKRLAQQFLKVRRTQKAQYERNDQYPRKRTERIFKNSRGAVALAERDALGSFCSGVLVARDLVLTAGHCFARVLPGEIKERLEVRFNFERDLSGMQLAQDRYPLDRVVAEGDSVFPDGPTLDFALVRVGQNSTGKPPGDTHPPQCLSPRQVRRDDPLYVIGHPRGDFRVVHDNAFVYFPFQVNRFDFTRLKLMVDAELSSDPRRQTELERFERSYRGRKDANGNELFEHYSEKWGRQPTIGANSDTYHGNSGSPVYGRRTHQVVGIFTEGEPDVDAPFTAGWRRHEAMIPTSEITRQLDRMMPEWRKEPGVCGGSGT